MTYSLEIKDEGRFEIIEAYRYYENAQEGLGERFLMYLEKCFDKICTNPEHYSIRRYPYREALVKKFPFLVIYEATGNVIVVYSVFNTWQDHKKKPTRQGKE